MQRTRHGNGRASRTRSRPVFALAILLACSNLGSEGPIGRVRLVTLEWEPYVGSAMPANGFIVEIVRRAFAHSGYEVEIEFRPWNRGIAEARQGRFDGLFPEYWASGRLEDFVYSSQIVSSPVGYVKRAGEDIAIGTAAERRRYVIGVVRGYIHMSEIEGDPELTLVEASDDLSLLRMLVGRRFDIAEMDANVMRHLLDTYLPEHSAGVEFVEPVREYMPLYIAFSKATPGYAEKLRAFDEGIARMRATGEIDEIATAFGY